jgi:hypothetical protein
MRELLRSWALAPIVLARMNVSGQHFLQRAVGLLFLAIGLRMIPCGHLLFSPQGLSESLPAVAGQPDIAIRHNVMRQPIPLEKIADW